jgi:hypothetical protein
MKIPLVLDDLVLAQTIYDSHAAGFKHVEAYISHLITGIAYEVITLEFHDDEDEELADDAAPQWVESGSTTNNDGIG